MNMKLVFVALVLAMVAGAEAVCNDCALQVSPVGNSICQGDSATYDIKITNAYAQAKAITLYAEGDTPMNTDMPSQVTVDAYQSRTLRVAFTPTGSITAGTHRITLKASGFGAEDSDDAIFMVNDCYTADLQLLQDTVNICEDSVGRLDFVLTNSGQKQDTYEATVSGIPDTLKVAMAGGAISIAPGGEREGSLTIRATDNAYGEYMLKLEVKSQQKTVSRDFKVNLMNCYHTFMDAPEVFTTCPDAGLTYTVYVKNDGVNDDYNLSVGGTCRARLSETFIHLGDEAEKQVSVTLEPIMGECDVTLIAKSQFETRSVKTHAIIMPCYAVDAQLVPEAVASACHGEPVTYGLKVTNKGFYADEYALGLEGINIKLGKTKIRLASEETETVNFTIIGTWCATKDVPFKATVKGHASKTVDGMLKFLPNGEACADLEMMPSQAPKQISCDGEPYTFFIKNSGYMEQEITLTVAGPATVIQPDSLKLKPGESREVALYLMPTATSDEPYVITVIAKDRYKRAYLELEVDFSGPVCGVARPAPAVVETPNGSSGGSGGASTGGAQTPTGAVVVGSNDGVILIGALLGANALVLLFMVYATGRKHAPKKELLFPEVAAATAAPFTEIRSTDGERLLAIKEAISRSSK